MAFAHDFILQVLLTREIIDLEAAKAALLSRILVEHWHCCGDSDQDLISRRLADLNVSGAPSAQA